MKNLCEYGCGQEGKYQFVNGKWCCSKNFHLCKAVRQIRSIQSTLRNKNSKIGKLRTKLNKGLLKCKYCGQVGKYIQSGSLITCSEKTKQCPEYSNVMSKIHLKRYKDHPEYGVAMSKAMKECQNRDSVKEKKSNSMKILHNEDCDKCVEFQKNYKKGYYKGRDTFRETLKNKWGK